MAKRRPVGSTSTEPSDEEEQTASETAEERRARRQRERRAREKGSTKAPRRFAGWSRWKKIGAFAGVTIAIVAAIAIVLVLVQPPCLAIAAPPPSSGVPDETSPSWCVNSSDAIDQILFVQLSIVVGGSSVSIPGGIGELSAAKTKATWGFSSGCDMPVFTDNSTSNGGSNSGGVIEIVSPWAFSYTISDFFHMWQQSYTDATVNGASEPVSYTGTQLFNYTTTANQVVRLWVDGSVSTAGVNLVLNTVTGNFQTSSEEPQCLVQKYGSGHSIVLTWGWVGAGQDTPGSPLHGMPGSTSSTEPGPTLDPSAAAPSAAQVALLHQVEKAGQLSFVDQWTVAPSTPDPG